MFPLSSGKCAAVPKHACAIAYDEVDCDRGDWDQPLEIPVTDLYDLESGDGGKNGIESVSVRKGCTLTMIDNDSSPWKDSGRMDFSAPAGRDLHVNINGNANKKIDALSDDVEQVICRCPGESKPTFIQL